MGNQASQNNQIKNNPKIASNLVNEAMKKKFSCMISYNDLVMTFRHFAVGARFLTYDKFNECISALLKFDIPLLPYTYLSEKLFNLMDKVSIEMKIILKSFFRIQVEKSMKKILLVI